MRISPIHRHIDPTPPLLIIPPLPKREEPEEPISFCGHLNRLLAIHRRHLMLERIMNLWARMTCWLGFPMRENTGRFSRIA